MMGLVSLLALLILVYIRQLLVLPSFVHDNSNWITALRISFGKIKTKHAIVAFFLGLAINFAFFMFLGLIFSLIGGLGRLNMPFLIQTPIYKYSIWVLLFAFGLLFYASRSAMLIYATHGAGEAPEKEQNSIIDHISEETVI